MTRFLACAALLIFALPAAAQINQPGPIRVMSYNIRIDVESDAPRWAERKDPMSKQIAFLAPDVLGVQEAQQTAVADLSAQLPAYSHYGLGRDDGKVGETTTVFWRTDRFEVLQTSTEWCSRTPQTPGKDYDAAYPRTITRVVLREKVTGRLLDIRNTHFDHVGVMAREQCAEQIEATPVWPKADIIVLGDFNSGPDSAPYRVLTDSQGLNLADARTLAKVDFGPLGTFNGFDITKSGDAIDHIFINRDTGVIRYGVLTDSFDGKVISDHFPIVADLVLPAER
jgi:endonuclease/exonuclease/phosphatase family metal-dependent hydrolase